MGRVLSQAVVITQGPESEASSRVFVPTATPLPKNWPNPMNASNASFSSVSRQLCACILLGVFLNVKQGFGAQSASPEPASPKVAVPTTSETITLSPFEVEGKRDDNSYTTLNSNSITGFNVPLTKLPLSADIMDETFMKDVGIDDLNTMIRNYAAGASYEGSGTGATAYATSDNGIESGSTTLRGLGRAGTKRDGLVGAKGLADTFVASFDVERVEVINGPQSLLYGNGAPGGVVNSISKQARFGRPMAGSLYFRVNNDGHTTEKFDFSQGGEKWALRASLVNQDLKSRRDFLGGPFQGYYAQLAFKLPGNTTLRVNGQRMVWKKNIAGYFNLNAVSAAADSRHNLSLGWLLATNQINTSATGASGAGIIANGHLDWDNVASYNGETRGTKATIDYDRISLETQWSKSFSTQLSAGYSFQKYLTVAMPTAFYSPQVAANPLKEWAVGTSANVNSGNNSRMWENGLRFSALHTTDLFNRRARSKTMLGADYSKNTNWLAYTAFFKADSNWNVIYDPAVAANNGRTLMPAYFWSIANGPVRDPLPGMLYDHRVTLNGQNYVRALSNIVDPKLISPQNPLGTTGTAVYQFTYTTAKGAYAVNHTEWLGGRLSTMVGGRMSEYYNRIVTPARVGEQGNRRFSYNLGATYQLFDWLHPYVGASDTYNQVGQNNDPYGEQPKLTHGIGMEAGLKATSRGGNVSGTIAFYNVKSENEQFAAQSAVLNAINPDGLNGRMGDTPNTQVHAAREARGVQLMLTAAPAGRKNWRTRFSAAFNDGRVGESKSYAQVYNDQFYQNSQGQVTYKNGALVYVNPTYSATRPVVPAGTAGAVPLTLAMMNSTTSPYYANPVPYSGAINTSSAVANVLRQVDPVNGPILTGAVGLPISALQINPGAQPPPGTITVLQAGERNTGAPKFSFNLTNIYTFDEGMLKGLRVGGTARLAWQSIYYYYYTNGVTPTNRPVPYYKPNLASFDAIVGYERRFRRYTWSVQANIYNMFNRYEVKLFPNAVSGWAGPNGANFSENPRSFTVSTDFGF